MDGIKLRAFLLHSGRISYDFVPPRRSHRKFGALLITKRAYSWRSRSPGRPATSSTIFASILHALALLLVHDDLDQGRGLLHRALHLNIRYE